MRICGEDEILYCLRNGQGREGWSVMEAVEDGFEIDCGEKDLERLLQGKKHYCKGESNERISAEFLTRTKDMAGREGWQGKEEGNSAATRFSQNQRLGGFCQSSGTESGWPSRPTMFGLPHRYWNLLRRS